jgi:uncharacterized membrane protein
LQDLAVLNLLDVVEPAAGLIRNNGTPALQGHFLTGAPDKGVRKMSNPQSTAKIAGHPLHPMVVPFPIAFLVGTLVTDLVYTQTTDLFWARASFWLLVAALVTAALAAVLGLTDFLGDARIRALRTATLHMIGNVVAVVLSLVNFWLRYQNGEAGAYPAGLWLSLVVVLLLLFNGWQGGELVFRHRVGVSDEPANPR